MVGWDVSVLQFLLMHDGFSPGGINGRFGASTEAALIRVQRSAGLTPDGILGPLTAAALRAQPRRFALSSCVPATRSRRSRSVIGSRSPGWHARIA